MANVLSKPKRCPRCGLDKILSDRAKQCADCRYGRTPGVAASSPIPSQPDASLPHELMRHLRRGALSVAALAECANASRVRVQDALVELQKSGANIHQFEGTWSLERAPEQGAMDVKPYLSSTGGLFRFGFTGDNHLCSKYERMDALHDLYRRFNDAGVDRVFNAGNWIDGEARFNKFDLNIHGMDNQVRYLVEQYPSYDGITTYAIAGDDHEGWYCQREGVDIGKYAEAEMRRQGRKDWVNLGYMEAFVPLKHKKTGVTNQLQLVHPGGGSAYATSYTVQKLVESYSGGSKPAVLLAGHYHKLEFINIRNVWAVQTGCTQDQTPFARKKRLNFSVGGGIMELEQDPDTGAIVAAKVEFFHYFDKGYHNNRWSMSGKVTLPTRSVQP